MRIFFKFSVLMIFLISIYTNLYPQQYFSTRLSVGELTLADSTISDTVSQNLAGTGVFILGGATAGNSANSDLRFIVSVGTNASGTDTASNGILRAVHFHLGAVGDTGRIVRSFTEGFNGNTLSASWGTNNTEPLTDDLRNELIKGNIYLIAKTDSGEIRGQIKPSSGTPFAAHLTAQQVVDSSASRASGVGSFLFTDLGLIYLVTVQGINVTGASINMGEPGLKGPSLFAIEFQGNSAFGIWNLALADSASLINVKALLAEMMYITVNSAAYAEGEIRGQLLHAGGFGFSSPLSGRDEQEDSTGTGSRDSRFRGNASYTLTPHGLVYHINLKTDGNMGSLAFRNNTTGEVLLSLPSVSDSSVSGAWLVNEPQGPLTDDLITDLFQGMISLYAEAGSDTLQGIIMPHKRSNFTALITGYQERPRVMSKASGVGHFILENDGLRYYITTEGLDKISNAHFHLAPVGVSGVPVRKIIFDSSGTASGVWMFSNDSDKPLTDGLLTALLKGEIYVNIHTPANPQGEIRGQLVAASGTDFKSHFTRRQSRPSIQGNLSGTGNFILTNEGLVYKITIDSLKVTGFDFSLGPVGTSGKTVRRVDVTADTSHTFVGVWRRDPAGVNPLALSDSLVMELLTGNMYITAKAAGGTTETLRGQILPNGGVGFVSMFNSRGTAAPAFENANGAAAYTLTDAGLKYDIAIDGFTGNAATIFSGESGPGAGTSQLLGGSYKNGVIQGAWLILNDTTASVGISGLFADNLYVQMQSTDTSNTDVIRAVIARDFRSPATSVHNTSSVPESFSMEQNYPNPFNPSTIIRFSIPENGAVNLSIYNVIGEKVITLIDQQDYKAGRYEVKFDASRLSSGVYFYRLNYGSNFTTRKMMLIK